MVLRGESFDEFDSFVRDGVAGAVGTKQVATLLEVPKAELQLFARHAEQIEQLAQTQRRLIRCGEPLLIEDGENLVSLPVFLRQGGSGGRIEMVKPGALSGAVLRVIGGALIGIAEGLVSVRNQAEFLGIARFAVIRMEALGLEAVYAMNGLLIGVRTDLERLVIVDEH